MSLGHSGVPGTCSCSLCLVLRRIADTITGPGLTPFFRESCLREVQILQARLLDLRDLFLAEQRRAEASAGAPPSAKAEDSHPEPGQATTPEGGSAEEREVKPEEAAKEENKEEGAKSAEESGAKVEEDKKSEPRKRAVKSRSRRRRKSDHRARSRSTRRESRKERKESDRSKRTEERSPAPVLPKEEPSTAELAREPIAEVTEEVPAAHPLLASTPKHRARPSAPSSSREPLPRFPVRESPEGSEGLRLRSREPTPSPPPHRESHWHSSTARSPRRPIAAKGRKKRERQQRIREIGWEAFHASKGR